MTIAIGTNNHNQRQPCGAAVSVEGGGLGSYTRSSPRSIGVSSIVRTTYQEARLGKEDKVTGVPGCPGSLRPGLVPSKVAEADPAGATIGTHPPAA